MTVRDTTLAVAILCTVSFHGGNAAWANPCSVDLFTGRNVVSGGSQPAIKIAREDIEITLHRTRFSGFVGVGSVDVAVDYVFENSDDPVDVVMGFPIGASVDDTPVGDFAISGTGVGPLLPANIIGDEAITERSDLSLCEKGQFRIGNQEEIRKLPIEPQTRWFLWRQRFGSGRTSMRVTYSHRALGGSLCKFHYFLRTTKHWGDGTIGRLTITVRETGARSGPGLDVLFSEKKPVQKRRQRSWSFENFAPREDLVLQLRNCS